MTDTRRGRAEAIARRMVHQIPPGIGSGATISIGPPDDSIQAWEFRVRSGRVKDAERAEAEIRGWIADAIARALPENNAALVGRLREAAERFVAYDFAALFIEAADALEGKTND